MCDVWCVMCDVWCVMCDVWCVMWCVMCDVWCVMCDVWCVMCDVWCVMWCVMCDVWCVMCDVWCVMRDVRCVIYFILLIFLVCLIWDCYGLWRVLINILIILLSLFIYFIIVIMIRIDCRCLICIIYCLFRSSCFFLSSINTYGVYISHHTHQRHNHTSHITHHTSHITHHTSHITQHNRTRTAKLSNHLLIHLVIILFTFVCYLSLSLSSPPSLSLSPLSLSQLYVCCELTLILLYEHPQYSSVSTRF